MAKKLPVHDRKGKLLRYVSRSAAEDMVEGFVAEPEFDEEGLMVSLRLTQKEKHDRLPIGSTITLSETLMNAGLYGPPSGDDSDPIQVAQDKIALWAFIHDTKAVCVSPRATQADVDRANQILRRVGNLK